MFLKERILNDHIKLDSQLIKPWLRCMLNFQSTDSSTADTMKLRVKGVCVKGQSNTGREHNMNSFELDVVGHVLCL